MKILKSVKKIITLSDLRYMRDMVKVHIAIKKANKVVKKLFNEADTDSKIKTLIIMKQEHEETNATMGNIICNFTPDRFIGRLFKLLVLRLSIRLDETEKNFGSISAKAIKKSKSRNFTYDVASN